MAQRKATTDDGKSQRQKFIDAARDAGADDSPGAFDRVLTKISRAPGAATKKAARKPKR
jgi:hypothetical protein